jgi:hypothetical protein
MHQAREHRHPLPRRALFAGAVVCIAGIGLLVWSRGRSEPASPGRTARTTPHTATPLRWSAAGGPATSESRHYEIEYRVSSRYSMRGPQGMESTEISAALAAELVRQPIDGKPAKDARDVLCALQISELATADIDAAVRDHLRTELQQPFVVRYRPTGAVDEIVLPAAMDSRAGRMIRDLISHLQFSRSEQAEWDDLHQQPDGEVRVSHRRLDDHRIQKQKREMVKVISGDQLLPVRLVGVVPAFPRSLGILTVDSSGELDSISIDEDTESKEANLELTSLTHAKISLRRLTTPAPAIASTMDLGSGRPLLDVAADRSEVVTPSRPVDDITADLAKALAKGDREAMNTLHAELVIALRHNPQGIAALVGEPGVPQAVLSALGAAGTPAAQVALVHVATDAERGIDERRAAVESFHDILVPEPDTVTTLQTLAATSKGSLRSDALFALGTAIGRRSAIDADGGGAALARLIAMYEAATTEQDLVEILQALGNTREPGALPTLQLALGTSSPVIQAAAIVSLRLIPDDRADVLIRSYLAPDVARPLKEAALTAASYREWVAVASELEALLRGEPTLEVRKHALDLISGFYLRGRSPAAGAALAWVAVNDPDQDLRARAEDVLSSRS